MTGSSSAGGGFLGGSAGSGTAGALGGDAFDWIYKDVPRGAWQADVVS